MKRCLVLDKETYLKEGPMDMAISRPNPSQVPKRIMQIQDPEHTDEAKKSLE